jgi:hypothetical protein
MYIRSAGTSIVVLRCKNAVSEQNQQQPNNVAYEKRRQEKPPEVEHHSLARGDGIAGFLQHRLCLHQVSLADDSSLPAHWPNAGLKQNAYPSNW